MLTTDTTHISLPFWGGAFIEATGKRFQLGCLSAFPLPFWRAFIEAVFGAHGVHALMHFPSFLEGLSLRQTPRFVKPVPRPGFPYLFGGTFNKIEQYPLKVTAGPLVLHLEV